MPCMVLPNARNARLMQTRPIRPFRRGAGGGPAPEPSPEDGLTLTTTIPVGGLVDFGDVGFTEAPYVLAMDFTGLSGAAGGGIAECGGSTTGAYIGFLTTGVFIARGGAGGTTPGPGTSYSTVAAASAPSGDGTLVVAFDRDVATETGYLARVWWNGVELPYVVHQRGALNALWGPDDGSYLGTPTIARGNSMAGQPDAPATPVPYTTASPLRVYADQRVTM